VVTPKLLDYSVDMQTGDEADLLGLESLNTQRFVLRELTYR
jgi:hypothetical protein